MTTYQGGQGPRRFDEAIRRWFGEPAARREGKVPMWTAEDEANLRRRVERIAAKAKP